MKTKIFIFLFTLVALSACTLDEVVVDRFVVDNFYKTENDAKSAITGVYSDLLRYGYYKSCYIPMLEASSDALFCFDGAESPIEFGQKRQTANTIYLKNVWTGMYQTIMDANLVIKYVQNSDFNQVSKNRILGEAYFLRGWTYFNLVRTFGGVPVKLEPTIDASNFHSPKSSVDSVYSVIFSDLLKANQLMPYKALQPATEAGRANKGSAQAILSLAYLTKGKWQEAYNWADSVITKGGYTLLDNYADLWDVSKESTQTNEVCFALQFTRDPLQSSANSIGSEMANVYIPVNGYSYTGARGTTTSGNGSGRIKVEPFFYKMYTVGAYLNDYRTEKSFLTKWNSTSVVAGKMVIGTTSMSPIGYYNFRYAHIAKYIDGAGLDSRNHENNLNIIRLAEVYLIKAEALNELDKPAEALAALNTLRARSRKAAGTPRTTPVDLTLVTLPGIEPTTKDKIREAIFHERGLELVGECSRWFDLVRMKRSNGKTYYEYMLDVTNGYASEHGLLAGVNDLASPGNCNDYVASNMIFNPRNLLFPISSEEFIYNKSFSAADQNPGY